MNMTDTDDTEIYLYICFNTDMSEIKIDDKHITLFKNQHIKTTLLELKNNFYPECLLLSTITAMSHGFQSNLKQHSIQLYLVENHFNESIDQIVYFRYFNNKAYLPSKKLIILPWNIRILNDRGSTNYKLLTNNWVGEELNLNSPSNTFIYWNNTSLMFLFIKFIHYLLKNRKPETKNSIQLETTQSDIIKEIYGIIPSNKGGRGEQQQQRRYIKKFFVFYCQSLGLI